MRMRLAVSLVVLPAACLLGAFTPLAGADLNATTRAIDRGIEFLLPKTKEQLEHVRAGGGDGREMQNAQGQLALQVYALLVAGVSHTDPIIAEAFQVMESMPLNHIYTLGCYIFALDAAIAQIESDLLMLEPANVRNQFRDNPAIGREYRPRLEQAVNALRRGQNAMGAWRYNVGANDFDNSNVQFAVLGLGVGPKRGITVEPEVWKKVIDHFVGGQQKEGSEIADRLTMLPESKWNRRKHENTVEVVARERSERGKPEGGEESEKKEDEGGRTEVRERRTVEPHPENPVIGTEDVPVFQRGWDYENKGGATWNMTCAGLSSLLLARRYMDGKLGTDAKQAVDKAVRDGYGWVMGHWNFGGNYYGMYSLEKVADIGHVEKFGAHDWYEEVSNHLIGAQRPDGSWPKGSSHGGEPLVTTSFALLILNRATATTLLTQNPNERIMISGRTSDPDNPDDRSWVYVPKLDTTIHFPSLVRTLTLRPNVKVLNFLENIIVNYPDEWKGELIPELARVRDAIPQKSAQRIVDDYLEEITGSKYKDFETYMKWYRRWYRVRMIGTTRKADRLDDLLKYYTNTEQSVPLKKTVMWALVQLKARDALPLFLDDLEHKDPKIRLAAYEAFKDFFVEYPPQFDPAGSASTRKAQVAAIRNWYREQRRKLEG